MKINGIRGKLKFKEVNLQNSINNITPKLPIFQLLTILDYQPWYQLNAKTYSCNTMNRYKNDFKIAYSSILMKTLENRENL